MSVHTKNTHGNLPNTIAAISKPSKRPLTNHQLSLFCTAAVFGIETSPLSTLHNLKYSSSPLFTAQSRVRARSLQTRIHTVRY